MNVASGATRQLLGAGRWHFQHGPMDCIVSADGDGRAVAAAIDRAWARFAGLLGELVGELPLLRADLSSEGAAALAPRGRVARRMVAACWPHAREGGFITAMAAVAGSVADELLGAFDDPRIVRAAINNGGDIALRLLPGACYELGLCANPGRDRRDAAIDGRFTVDAASPARGVATSGWRGRSFSLGIADSVTILAASASVADAAATIVANAVDVDDARIVRAPASTVKDDSDLGDRRVTRFVPTLPARLVELALERGAAEAEAQIGAGRIIAAALSLQGRWRVVGDVRAVLPAPTRAATLPTPKRATAHAVC